MTKHDIDFDGWFDTLALQLSDEGIRFSDRESVRADYDAGKDLFDVVDEILVEPWS